MSEVTVMEFLILIFVILVGFYSLKIILKLFWIIVAPLANIGAMLIIMYLFSLALGKWDEEI